MDELEQRRRVREGRTSRGRRPPEEDEALLEVCARAHREDSSLGEASRSIVAEGSP